MDNSTIESILTNPRSNTKNHFIADCPFCGKEQHLFVRKETHLFDKYGVNRSFNWDCKKCLAHGRIYKLLAHLGQLHLLDGELVDIDKELETALVKTMTTDEEININVVNGKLPVGFERVYKDDYLDNRGFTSHEFRKYVVGRTDLSFKYKDYIIISVEESNECKGYIARSILTKDKIDAINAKYKRKGLKKKYARYRNSETQFAKLLLGFDEITFLTETVILVEGFFDKVRTDQALSLDAQQEFKCCCTFGSSVSKEQTIKLLKRGVQNVILIQDPDAVEKSKKTGFELGKYFNTLIGYTGEKDLGDSTEQEINTIFKELENPTTYSLSKLQNVSLG